MAVGAEYLVHSYGNGGAMLQAPDFLVVDTAVYPKQGTVAIHQTDFRLRITPAKGDPFQLEPQAPQFVGLGTQFPMGGSGGRQSGNPGDPGVSSRPPQAPDGTGTQQPEVTGNVAVRAALPEGQTTSPKAGLLFFSFTGKTKKLKGMDLIYKAAGGEVVVNLF